MAASSHRLIFSVDLWIHGNVSKMNRNAVPVHFGDISGHSECLLRDVSKMNGTASDDGTELAAHQSILCGYPRIAGGNHLIRKVHLQ